MKLEEIGVVVLSHGRRDKLEKSLKSYEENGLIDMVGDNFIFFNEVANDDISLIENDYKSFEWGGHPQNLGIGWGMTKAIDEIQTEYVLFLENDFELQSDEKDIYLQLEMGYRNIKEGKIDIVKYRNLDDYINTSNEARLWHIRKGRQGVEETGHMYIGFAVEENYGYDNLDICNKVDESSDKVLWSMSCKNAGWSNNPFLCRKEWFLEIATTIGFDLSQPLRPSNMRNPDFEEQIGIKYWVEQNYKVGILPGLFIHQP